MMKKKLLLYDGRKTQNCSREKYEYNNNNRVEPTCKRHGKGFVWWHAWDDFIQTVIWMLGFYSHLTMYIYAHVEYTII